MSNSEREAVQSYVANQVEHHRKLIFGEELRIQLKENGKERVEKYWLNWDGLELDQNPMR